MAEKKTKKVDTKVDSKKSKTKAKKDNTESVLTISDSEVREYASIFSEHKLKLLEIESGDTKLTLKKSDENVAQNVQNISYQIPTNIAPMPAQLQMANTPLATETPATEKSEPVNSNYLEIKSPIVGTYYSAASPDSPPYVKEGDVVSAETVVGIVEAMKMMNEIKAGINGKIVRRVVDNNTAIEENATLFLVEP